jgi:hypothetical protein
MQIKMDTIALFGGDWIVEKMNAFLRGQKIRTLFFDSIVKY